MLINDYFNDRSACVSDDTGDEELQWNDCNEVENEVQFSFQGFDGRNEGRSVLLYRGVPVPSVGSLTCECMSFRQ